MANAHGDFIWYELMTPDPAGAKAFYERFLPWSIDQQGSPMPGPMSGGAEYREIRAPEGHAGGVLTLTPEMLAQGAGPAWIGYVGVDDVDDAVARLREAGGAVHMEPMDMEGVGRMAMAADPLGATFYVMRGASDEDSTAYRTMSDGHVAWNELTTPDDARARKFYYALFGWTDGEEVPLGEMGRYRMFDQQGRSIGAIMEYAGEAPLQGWLYYIAVPDIDAAASGVAEGGGTVTQGPDPIPGDMFCLVANDPQGATFALVGPRKE